jgi:RPA family protein
MPWFHKQSAQDIVDNLHDDTIDLHDFVTASLEAAKQDVERLKALQDKLESVEKDEEELYADGVDDETLHDIRRQLSDITTLLSEAHELEHEEQETNTRENTKRKQILGYIKELKQLYEP